MALFINILVFILSIGIVWFFAGMLIEAVGRIARRFCKTGFIVAFFILGSLTSISEFSVAIHATATGVPAVSVGNIIGGSLVLLLFVVPVLAIAGKGVTINAAVSRRSLLYVLLAILLPAILVMDGSVTRTEGLIALLSYGALGYKLYRERQIINACDVREEATRYRIGALFSDIGRVFIGAFAVFIAAYVLVEQSIYVSETFAIAPSVVGLILLSIGTNIPEMAIALRSIFGGKVDVAFGNYLGSATMNTFLFGLVGVANGTFLVVAKSLLPTALIMIFGFICLYVLVRKKNMLTPKAAGVLILFYAVFLGFQFTELF